LDLLQSDYPQKGIQWLSILLEHPSIPLALQRQIHLSLAQFFVAHLSHELASEHFLAAEKLANDIRESEVNQQWVRYQADEAHQSLRKQVAQHKKNNQILAESNALLQAVNRIAMVVNASLDMETLLRRLREQLTGWIDAEYIGIAELRDDHLYYRCALDGERKNPDFDVPMTEARSWSVRAVREGRILYENNFVMKDELLVTDECGVTRSVSFTPLKCENKVIGLLSLQSRKEDCFDTRSVTLLEYISPVIGIAFANLLNFERTQELSGELSKQQQELHDVRQLMAHMSDHDELTGLPYRNALPEHFERWVLKAPFHCIAIKLTNLIAISKDLGFGSEGDVVKIVAQRLRNRLRPDDLLIRMGDDQFFLLVEHMKSRDHLFEFSKQLLQLIEQPLRAKDQTVGVESAIGMVQYPDHGESLEEIVSMISVALQHAEDDSTSIFSIE
jgi:diguanylate cyclase (GGDEF)-like protein